MDEGEIEDEVGDSYVDDDGIEDFYGDDTFKDNNGSAASRLKGAAAKVENEEGEEVVEEDAVEDDELDLDYSQTHLDDFLKSHASNN